MINDPKYPIYRIDVKWSMDDDKPEETHENWRKNLSLGRQWNSTGFNKMYRVDPGLEKIRDQCLEWWGKYIKKGENPSEPEFNIEPQEEETWCMGWFDHWTFDISQSDEEALISFEQFLKRKGIENLNYGCDPYYEHRQDGYPTMGAEDRWRWGGIKDPNGEDTSDNKTDPPCRCSGCKKNGVIRIVH